MRKLERKKELLEALEKGYKELKVINDMEEDGNHILNELGKEAIEAYPFHISFDEFLYEFKYYINELSEEIEEYEDKKTLLEEIESTFLGEKKTFKVNREDYLIVTLSKKDGLSLVYKYNNEIEELSSLEELPKKFKSYKLVSVEHIDY